LCRLDIGRSFVSVPELPLHPLVRKAASTWSGSYKIRGSKMKIDYTKDARAVELEEVMIGRNAFIAQFDIRGGTHHGYIREFNCGDHPSFALDLGGRLYSVGDESYQGLSADERKLMTIDGRPVIELDIRASALTIFHGQRGQPLDFEANPDPSTLPELSDTPRDVVKKFITATFGSSQFPARWPQKQAHHYKEATGQSLSKQHPISQVRSAVARAYLLLAELRRDDAAPPLWAKLMYRCIWKARRFDPPPPPITNNDKGTVQAGSGPGKVVTMVGLHPTNLLLKGGQRGKVDPRSIPK
jgi:hypothetical protein